MAVKTQVQTIGSAWVQLSDGTQTKTMQVLNADVIDGVVFLVDADEAPPSDTKGHVVDGWMTITPPTKAWVRATGTNLATIAIS